MGQCDGNEDGMDLRGNCGIDRRVLSMVEGGALDVRGAGVVAKEAGEPTVASPVA